MVVVRALLDLWKQQNHRVLLFCQTRQMLDILEIMIRRLGYNYRRMDGATPVHHRMSLVTEFNTHDDIYVFLLTTKVGGLGLNLTGANRVILFDPDWVSEMMHLGHGISQIMMVYRTPLPMCRHESERGDWDKRRT